MQFATHSANGFALMNASCHSSFANRSEWCLSMRKINSCIERISLASNEGFTLLGLLGVPLTHPLVCLPLHIYIYICVNVLATFSINTYFISVCICAYISHLATPVEAKFFSSISSSVSCFFVSCWFASVLLYIYYIRIWCFDVLPALFHSPTLSLSLSLFGYSNYNLHNVNGLERNI